MGTNTSDVVMGPTVDVLRPPHMEANTQTSIPTVEVLIPHVMGDNTMLLHVSLSILGCEHDPLRASGIRLPPVRAQEVSMIPQLDGLGSLLIRDHTRGRMVDFQIRLNKTPPKKPPMCGELPPLGEENTLEEIVIVMIREDCIETKDPLIEEDTQIEVEDSLIEEDTLVEDPLRRDGGPLEEDILMEVGDPLVEEDILVEEP